MAEKVEELNNCGVKEVVGNIFKGAGMIQTCQKNGRGLGSGVSGRVDPRVTMKGDGVKQSLVED